MPARSPWSASARSDRSMQDYLRGSGPSADAMAEPTGPLVNADPHGLSIRNIRRLVAREALTGLGSNITVSDTSFAALSTALEMELELSGRPLEVTLTATCAAGSGGNLILDVLLRGTSITGIANGMIFTNSQAIETRERSETVMEPDPGPASLQVVAMRVSSDGTIYADASNAIVLRAAEK